MKVFSRSCTSFERMNSNSEFRFTITAAQLRKLVNSKVRTMHCCNHNCIAERASMRNAILSLAEVFDDIYYAYLAQEKLLSDIMSSMNTFSTNFSLPICFRHTTNSERLKRLCNMSKMIRMLLLKQHSRSPAKRTDPSTPSASKTADCKGIPSVTNVNSHVDTIDSCLKRKHPPLNDTMIKRNKTIEPLTNSTILPSTLSPKSMPSHQQQSSNNSKIIESYSTCPPPLPQQQNKTVDIVVLSDGDDDNDVGQIEESPVSNPPPLLSSSINHNANSVLQKLVDFTSNFSTTKNCTKETAETKMSVEATTVAPSTSSSVVITSISLQNPGSETLEHIAEPASATATIAKTTAETATNNNLLETINVLSTALMLSASSTSSPPSPPTLQQQQPPPPLKTTTTTVSVIPPDIGLNSLNFVLAPSVTPASSRSSSYSSLPPLLTKSSTPVSGSNGSSGDASTTNHSIQIRRVKGKLFQSNSGRYYIANSMIITNTKLHPLPFPPTIPKLSFELQHMLPKLKKLNAKIICQKAVCVVKFGIEYDYKSPDQKFFFYYYLKNNLIDLNNIWQSGQTFQCRRDGKSSMTVQFEEVVDDEVLLVSFRFALNALHVGEFSIPIAIRLGEASHGETLMVDFDEITVSNSVSSASSLSLSSSTIIQCCNLDFPILRPIPRSNNNINNTQVNGNSNGNGLVEVEVIDLE